MYLFLGLLFVLLLTSFIFSAIVLDSVGVYVHKALFLPRNKSLYFTDTLLIVSPLLKQYWFIQP